MLSYSASGTLAVVYVAVPRLGRLAGIQDSIHQGDGLTVVVEEAALSETDRSDRRSFVGRNDAGPTPRVQSAVSGIRTASGSAAANSVGQQQAVGQMYPPRLVLASDLRASRDLRRVVDADTAIDLANRLTELVDGSAIEVSVVDRTATIRGVVVSAKDRRRAEILASFEPGVSVVVNDLRLADDSEVPSLVAPPDPVPAPIAN